MKFYQHESPETITTTLYLKLNMNMSEGFFFSSTIIGWNNLNDNIQNLELVSAFEKQMLKVIRQSPNNTFNVHKS